MKKCIECHNFDLRSFPEHAKNGEATCNVKMEFFQVGQEIACEFFDTAGILVIEKRRAWRDKKLID